MHDRDDIMAGVPCSSLVSAALPMAFSQYELIVYYSQVGFSTSVINR